MITPSVELAQRSFLMAQELVFMAANEKGKTEKKKDINKTSTEAKVRGLHGPFPFDRRLQDILFRRKLR